MDRHFERIDIGKEMPQNAISVDELQNIGLLFALFGDIIVSKKRWVVILGPAERRII